MFEQLKRWYYRKKAIRALLRRYYLDTACDVVLKDYITACIIERGQENRRKELLESQAKIKEQELFIKWLKNQH